MPHLGSPSPKGLGSHPHSHSTLSFSPHTSDDKTGGNTLTSTPNTLSRDCLFLCCKCTIIWSISADCLWMSLLYKKTTPSVFLFHCKKSSEANTKSLSHPSRKMLLLLHHSSTQEMVLSIPRSRMFPCTTTPF